MWWFHTYSAGKCLKVQVEDHQHHSEILMCLSGQGAAPLSLGMLVWFYRRIQRDSICQGSTPQELIYGNNCGIWPSLCIRNVSTWANRMALEMDNPSWFCISYFPCYHLQSGTISFSHEELHCSIKPPISLNKTPFSSPAHPGETLSFHLHFLGAHFYRLMRKMGQFFVRISKGGKNSESFQECLRHSPKYHNAAIYLAIILFL